MIFVDGGSGAGKTTACEHLTTSAQFTLVPEYMDILSTSVQDLIQTAHICKRLDVLWDLDALRYKLYPEAEHKKRVFDRSIIGILSHGYCCGDITWRSFKPESVSSHGYFLRGARLFLFCLPHANGFVPSGMTFRPATRQPGILDQNWWGQPAASLAYTASKLAKAGQWREKLSFKRLPVSMSRAAR